MKTLLAWLLSTTGALAISAEEIAKYITMKSDYTPTEDPVELLHRFKITKDIHTTRWAQWNQSWKSWHHIGEKKVTRRMIAPGLLIETNKAEKPEQVREAEITWLTKDGWRRSTAFNIDGKWVIAFDWKGDEIRPGWINWQMVASVDGWGSEKQSKAGKLHRIVHERTNDDGWSVLTCTELIGDKVETGMFYYSGSGVALPR